MTAGRWAALTVVAAAGLLAGVALVSLRSCGGDRAASTAVSTTSSPGGEEPGRAGSAGVEQAGARAAPAATTAAGRVPPAPGAPQASPEEIARWQATEPIALHAARDAHRWLEVADRLRARAADAPEIADLEIRARTCAGRLQRALEPQTEDEVLDALVTEVDLLRELSFLARDTLHDDELLALLQDIEMGAHHALQGAPPPEAFDEPVVPEGAGR